MSINKQQKDVNQSVWVSLTGYRLLIVLKSLMLGGKTLKELIDILRENQITSKSVSPDTVHVSINTLKALGCEISRPTKTRGYKYELISHPFCLQLSEVECNSLILLRNNICNEISWKKVMVINSLYEKLFSLTFNGQLINFEKDSRILGLINLDILNILSDSSIIGKKLNITYLSPKFGNEDFDIIPKKITYENTKLYLNCYIFKYNSNSILNIERIININKVEDYENCQLEMSYDVIYKIQGSSVYSFQPAEYETVIEKSKDCIKVCAKVENEFSFIQRLLLLGSDFKIVSPDFFREKLINKLIHIKKGYEDAAR